MIPLQSDRRPFTVAISKGSGLVDESRSLLLAWRPGESLDAFTDRVLEQDILGRSTAGRTRDLVRRVFARRFLTGRPPPASALQTLYHLSGGGRWFTDICVLQAARADDLLRATIAELYFGARSRGKPTLSVDDVRNFVVGENEARSAGRPWSAAVTLKVSRGLLQALEEFGLLQRVPGQRDRALLRREPTNIAVAYLAHDLHFRGVTDLSLAVHRDWLLWGLNARSVLQRMGDSVFDDLWVIQSSNDAVTITWRCQNMEVLVEQLARSNTH